MAQSRRVEAVALAEELLDDIELRRISPTDIVRKTSRLARLTDDAAAMEWLAYEIVGYGESTLDEAGSRAANRSFRYGPPAAGGSPTWWTSPLGELQASIESNRTALASLTGDVGGEYAGLVERQRQEQRTWLTGQIASQTKVVDRVVGAIYIYVTNVNHALRFGSAAETAFEVVRAEVDLRLSTLIPDALPKLSAAFESASSTNPEHWANAASTCRRLLKAAADALRPPGEEKDRRKMTDAAYINRLVDWIKSQATSTTAAQMIAADLEYLGRRLDAADQAGHKGAHDEVDRLDASRFVVGTYIVLGDILRLSAGQTE
jgi:hypothetical protein